MMIGCSSSKNPYEGLSENDLYSKAETELNSGSLPTSVAVLEELDKSYPFGPNSQQVQLNLIYAYYKTGEYSLAIAAIDRFLKLNPTNPYVDWVLYMRGITNMELDKNTIQGLFKVDRYNRDPSYNQTAFKDFTYLISRFPDSPYSYDAELRLIFLKNQLAKHEFSIARYYSDRGAYVAVINRVYNMLQTYPDTDATKQALYLMRDAYQKLGLQDNVEKTNLLIEANKDNVTKKEKSGAFFGWF